jgi:hypothetical protein
MMLQGRNYATAFLLGAGATRGAIPHVLVNQKRLKAPLNGDFFKVAATYARAMGTTSLTAQRLRRVQRVFKQEVPFRGDPTMEEAFSLLVTAKDLPKIYRKARGITRIAGQMQEIEDFLRLTAEMLVRIDQDAPRPTGYDRLVSTLGGHDVAITLNYDTLLDSALRAQGWDPRFGYRLSGGFSKTKWLPDRTVQASPAAGVHLLKLHGSLNWFVRGSYAQLGKVYESKPVYVSPPRTNEKARHIRQIMPPVFGKAFRHEHWQKLWMEGFEALRTAEAVVVIGCSLIDTDFHLRALIGRVAAVRKAARNPIKRLVLVGDTRTRRKWRRAFKGRVAAAPIEFPRFDAFLQQGLHV